MILGLDVGTRRIGVALMHEEALLPMILETIDVSHTNPFEAIKLVMESQQVSTVVVGYPRRQDGSSSHQTELVEAFADDLKKHIGENIKIVFQDESLTSVKAEEELGQGGAFSKEAVDALAAVYILEDYARLLKGLA